MTCSTPVKALKPILFSATEAILDIAPVYMREGENGPEEVFDVQVTLVADIVDGRITHTRKHTYPSAVLGIVSGLNKHTLQPQVDWAAAAPLFVPFDLEIVLD